MRKLGRFALTGIAALVLLVLGMSGPSTAVEASETTVTLTWSPWVVSGFDETPQNWTECASPNPPCVPGKLYKPCYDCYITSVTPELEGFNTVSGTWGVSSYTSSPPARLHHMVLFNHAQTDATCAGNPLFSALGDRWFASGDERATLAFPAGYGYYIPPGDGLASNYWFTQVMIHNLSSLQQTFRLKMTFKYHPATDNLKPVRHLWLDQNNCASSQYQVDPGYNDDHWAWTDGSAAGTADDVEGRIFEMGGHVHDWGTSVAGTLMKMGTITETLICASQGGYASGSTFAPDHIASPGSPAPAHPADALVVSPSDPGYLGHIEAMTGCLTNTLIAPGDMIHLHTQYVADAMIPDVMGIMGAWVYDNCPAITNPTQEDLLDDGYPGDGIGDDFGDACDKDADGDSLCDTGVQGPGGFSCTSTDDEDDGDGYKDEAESGTPVCLGNTNDDDKTYPVYPGPVVADDSVVNDGCPAIGAAEADCANAIDDDGDLRVNDGCSQVGVFSEGAYNIGTNPLARCGAGGVVNPSPSWPSDFISNATTTDKVTLQDVTSFVAPTRRYETNPGHPNFSSRYDLTPGRFGVTTWINLNDITAMVGGATGSPPMFGGATKAFNGPVCTGA